jgi:hypothetical protein
MRAELSEAGVFTDTVRLVRTAEAIARAVELDDRLTLNRIRQLVTDHRDTLRADIDARTVPGERVADSEAWLLAPDEQAAQELFRWLQEGDPERSTGSATDGEVADGDAPGGDGSPDASDTTEPEDDAPAGSTPQRCG